MIDIYQKTAKHKTKCEDYVATNNKNLIILSDGCSSSKDTHIGSMLYCEKGMPYFEKYLEETVNQQDWRTLALIASQTFEKRDNGYEYLDATCIVLKAEDRVVSVSFCGDGLLFYKYKDCPTYFQEYYYEGNAPLYPSYFLDPKRLKNHEELENNEYNYNTTIGKNSVSFPVGTKLPTKYLEIENLEYVGIASDGVFDFRKNGEVIDSQIVFEHITGFKGDGKFLTRRLNYMFKTFEKEGIFPHDDFSIGVWKNDNI